MKVSVICTLKNEERSVKDLLDSLYSQHKKPDEIIFVDGGSTDNTVETIRSCSSGDIPVKLIEAKGVNIARGRNIAINNARYDHIVSIDAGCRADKYWLRNFMDTFENDPLIDVTAGFFLPDARSIYEDVAGNLLYPRKDLMDPENFLPPGNSIAFKKSCWERAGGYPEWLDTGEDCYFDLKLKETGAKFAFARNAIVYWRPRPTLYKLFKQYFFYAKGSAQAGITYKTTFKAYGTNIIKYTIYNTSRYCLELFKKRKLLHLFYVPVILTSVLLAKISGMITGEVAKKYLLYKKVKI